jgi:hypothetical protein
MVEDRIDLAGRDPLIPPKAHVHAGHDNVCMPLRSTGQFCNLNFHATSPCNNRLLSSLGCSVLGRQRVRGVGLDVAQGHQEA